jgi:hypothetical protein
LGPQPGNKARAPDRESERAIKRVIRQVEGANRLL